MTDTDDDRIKTGIDGLDSILNGGLRRNSTVLVSGNPGTGKSILGAQYLDHGVREHGEGGVYLTFEETQEDVIEAAESIGMEEWREHVENDDIIVYDKMDLLEETDFSQSLVRILDDIDSDSYSRLVMDSLTMFQMFFESEQEKRTYLLKLIDILKHNGFTSLLVQESQETFPDRDIGLEEFLTDGNIYLAQTPTKSGTNRYIWVAKMRKQEINTHVFPMEIGDGGVRIHDNAAEFSYMSGEDVDMGNEPGGGRGGL
ncbi:circadian regulator CirA [Haladaptatus sp. F3-133]|uniref:Circadian regulator CirA n=1 Tax=Halorutilus salinus TaxID=2487751 RepID=A0A9Q4C247_9EURY|nr:ATPase domain-containing protein [Halorutilus salinus]MCX2818505.1 circadian regulator CirA [Halorutilus salinus]